MGAALAKLALTLVPKDKLLKGLMFVVIGLLGFVLVLVLFVGSLFENIPIGRDSSDYDAYKTAAEKIKTRTKISVDFREVMAIDAVLLEQDFSRSDPSRAEMMTNLFVRSEKTNEQSTCTHTDVDGTTTTKDCVVEVTKYHKRSLDTVLRILVQDGTITEEQIPIIKRYTRIDFSMLASSEEFELPTDWTPFTGEFIWPVPSTKKISSHFGMRIHPITGKKKEHNGMDIPATIGTEIVAIGSGVVTKAEMMGTAGKTIIIDHGDNKESRYYHLDYIGVKKGQMVEQGEYIGDVGNTGGSTGPHLHLEIRINKTPVNPYQFYK